jgi:hypothetical protein
VINAEECSAFGVDHDAGLLGERGRVDAVAEAARLRVTTATEVRTSPGSTNTST